MATDPPFRLLPRVDPDNAHFWTGGAEGELRILRCTACETWVHPPAPLCPSCLGEPLEPRPTSGRATLHSYTVNHHPWIPGFDPPYVIAIVELPEQAGLRLTSNLVGCAEHELEIGMSLRVRFEARDDGIYLPLFEPAAPETETPASLTKRLATRPPARTAAARPVARGERSVVISGIGQSAVGRPLDRHPLALTADACLAAIADAGLSRDDIDGLATYPGGALGAAQPGFAAGGTTEIQELLGLQLDWWNGTAETSGQLGAVITAAAAVAAGYAKHVLCFRTVWESTAQGGGGRRGIGTGSGGGGGIPRMGGDMQWRLPFGAASAACWIAMMARRHFHEFGTTREQLAWIALNARRNAALNPAAIYRDPMSLDDYLSARMISSPFGLYDCDVPVDGSTAFVISHADVAADLPRPALRIEAIGSALRGRPSWDQFDDLTTMALRDAAAMMWERTALEPTDVDVAECYDGFSFITLAWLEALGFCEHGEGGPFIDGGERIALDGEIPLNTHGGQLSAGRLHGFGFLHEACLQLRGEAGARQVPGDPEVGVAAAGGGPLGGCLLITRS